MDIQPPEEPAEDTTGNSSHNTPQQSSETTESSSRPAGTRDEDTTADTQVRADTNRGQLEASDGPRTVIPADAYKTAPASEPELAPREAVDRHVDTQEGSTALSGTEAWVQTNSRDPHNDGRSHTRTYFNPNDVIDQYPGGQKHRDPSDRRSWATLAQWQDGVQSDKSRGSQNWWADKKRWVNMFADKMGATTYHEKRCQHVIEEMDLSTYQPDRIPAELLIIAVLSLLIDHDIDNPDNFENRALKRGETESLLADIDASITDYQNARSKIQQRDGDTLFSE